VVSPAPPGPRCPHELGCPAIEGWNAVSLKRNYLSQERDLAKARQSIGELGDALRRAEERREQLEREKADLQAKIRLLHQRQFKANRKKPEDEKPRTAAVKKRGAPRGHPPWLRKRPATFDRTIEVSAPGSCPYCHSTDLREMEGAREHWQEDIVLLPRMVATRFLHRRARCAIRTATPSGFSRPCSLRTPRPLNPPCIMTVRNGSPNVIRVDLSPGRKG